MGTTYIANGAACTITGNSPVTWGCTDAFTSSGGGSLTITEYDIYQAGATLVGTNVTMTTRVAFRVFNPVVTGTLTNNIGLDLPLLTGATNNTEIRIGGQTQTLTSLSGPACIDIFAGTNTFNFASGTLNTLVNCTGTVVFNQAARSAGMGTGYTFSPIMKTANGVSANLGASFGFVAQPTFQADGGTIADAKAWTGFLANPTYSQIASGAITTGIIDSKRGSRNHRGHDG
jgi:hypothetical protein